MKRVLSARDTAANISTNISLSLTSRLMRAKLCVRGGGGYTYVLYAFMARVCTRYARSGSPQVNLWRTNPTRLSSVTLHRTFWRKCASTFITRYPTLRVCVCVCLCVGGLVLVSFSFSIFSLTNQCYILSSSSRSLFVAMSMCYGYCTHALDEC